MGKRLIAVQSGLGKTYSEQKYEEILDTDKYTLSIKYHREEYPELTDEEFKSIQKIPKEDWFNNYVQKIEELIRESKEDILLFWLNMDLIKYLYEKGYNVDIVIYNPECVSKEILTERFLSRGNDENFSDRIDMFDIYHKYVSIGFFQVYVLNKDIFLDDFLVATGSKLKNYNKPKQYTREIKKYITKISPFKI